jgi:hypothetical protein
MRLHEQRLISISCDPPSWRARYYRLKSALIEIALLAGMIVGFALATSALH